MFFPKLWTWSLIILILRYWSLGRIFTDLQIIFYKCHTFLELLWISPTIFDYHISTKQSLFNSSIEASGWITTSKKITRSTFKSIKTLKNQIYQVDPINQNTKKNKKIKIVNHIMNIGKKDETDWIHYRRENWTYDHHNYTKICY